MQRAKRYFLEIVNDERKGFFSECLKCVLFGMSYIYSLGSQVAKMSCILKKRKLPCAVISVGNITWGGTGKTSLVDLLLQLIIERNKTVAVLMRGYGSDEDVLLSKEYPMVKVLCGKDRYSTGISFLKNNHVDVFLLDDGFQQWGIERDLDIITINCLNPWGNEELIPRGILREPLISLKRADFVILTNTNLISEKDKVNIKERVASIVSRKQIIEAVHKPIYLYKADRPSEELPVDSFRGKRVIVFSGIGSPESFKMTLDRLGINIVKNFVFDDHYQYKNKDFLEIKNMLVRDSSLKVITTEKDLMRNYSLIIEDVNPYVLKIKMELQKNRDSFITRLDRVLGS